MKTDSEIILELSIKNNALSKENEDLKKEIETLKENILFYEAANTEREILHEKPFSVYHLQNLLRIALMLLSCGTLIGLMMWFKTHI